MSQDEDKNEPKVVNLADARKRQRTVRAGAQGKAGMNGAGKAKAPSGKKSIWTYVQVILFLAIVAYAMQLCRSGGS